MPVSKPTPVATEGRTVDGRNITKEWIQQMASHYDPEAFTATANLEHIRSYLPDSPFSSKGKVVSLSSQEKKIFGVSKLQLMAVVDVPQEVVDMQKKGQKAFSSIEVSPDFAGNGFAYLTGIAFTDTPASLGTQPLLFSREAKADNVFNFAEELTFEFEAETPAEKPGDSLFTKVVGLLKGKDKNDEARFADVGKAVEAVASSQKDVLEQFSTLQGELKKAGETITKLTAEVEKDRKDFADLKASLESQESGAQRPAAAGGNGVVKTDC